MKKFFSRNRKLVEIVLTLGLVFLVAGYYYLIYIPERENEIIARRFRTLQRIEANMQEKLQGYQATIRNCLTKADESFFNEIVKGYNTDPEKFRIVIAANDTIIREKISQQKSKYDSIRNIYDSLGNNVNDSTSESHKFKTEKNGKKLTITYDWYRLREKEEHSLKHISLVATIDNQEFLKPLLKKGIFEHYIVFNVQNEISNIIYEDFNSGISFRSLDSLFDTKEKIYTSRIVKIETAGVKYLAFLHPSGYNNKNDRIIAGLLKQETFDSEKRQLPESMVTTILFITLFCLLLLPVIRLALMGKRERIRFFDLFAGYFSFLLLVPVIILVFIWNNKRFLSAEEIKGNSKQVLADQISRSLNNEIDSAYELLSKVDALYSDSFPILNKINVRNLNHQDRDTSYIDTLFSKSALALDRTDINSAVRKLDALLKIDSAKLATGYSVFWMDTTGKEIANWAFRDNPMPGSYKDRDYFKNVLSKNEISLNDSGTKSYAISPIVSRTDGKFKVVIAKKSINKKNLIGAYTSRFSSVINPVLPLGYEFSITDEAGNTIFDSDTTENLNENLREEFADSAAFKSLLETKTSREFTTRHEDEDFNVLAQPISGLPYFIVILEKQSFNTSLYTQSLSFTMVMMFSFFLFLCIEMIIILIANYQSTKLQKNSFDFSWIHPRKNLSAKYFSLFLFNSSIIILLILFCFIQFSNRNLTGYIFLFIMATLITSTVAFSFKSNGEGPTSMDIGKFKREKFAKISLSVLAIIALINAYHFSVHIMVLLFSATSILLFVLLNSQRRRINGTITNNYMMNFRLMVFSRLILTSGLPVIVFFSCIYNFEQKLEERLKLLDYAKTIEQRTRQGEAIPLILYQIENSHSIKEFYTDACWIVSANDTKSADFIDASYNKGDSICIHLLKTSRLHYNDVSDNTENYELLKPYGSTPSQFTFNSILSNSVDMLRYGITVLSTAEQASYEKATTKYFVLSSASNSYAFPSIVQFGGFVFWIMLFGCLALCYLLLIYATNKIFGKNIPATEDFDAIPGELLMDEKIKYLFVQGTPNSDKSAFIKNHLQGGDKFTFCDATNPQNKYNALIFNLNAIPDEEEMILEKEVFDKLQSAGFSQEDNWFYKSAKLTDDKIECIVFTHFEYKIFDDHTNRIKLNLIEKIIRLNKKKIIISSDIDPVEYFYSLKKFMLGSSEKSNKKADSKILGSEPDATASFFEYINRWNNLLGRFTNIYINNVLSVNANDSKRSFKDDFLANECSYPDFLNEYKTQFAKLNVTDENEEDYILKIQSLCDHSYRHIWSSLTKEEQLTLYDLAEDGLVNTTNYISITMLLNKRLVVKDANGVLMIINRSFRNFILTVVNSAEAKSIEKEISDDHTWNDYKYPVLIILAALLYFVLSSNPEKFGNVLPVITGVLAGIPTIIKMFSFMKPGEPK